MAKKKTRTCLPFKDKIKIVDILRKRTKSIGDGLISYEEGWDDNRVATEVGSHVSGPNHVQVIRVTQFGKLFHKRKKEEIDSPAMRAISADLISRIEILELRVNKIFHEFELK